MILGVRREGVNVARTIPHGCTKGFLMKVLLMEYTHWMDILPPRFLEINRIA